MPQPRPWEHCIGLGLESVYGVAVAPTIFVPGTSSLKKPTGRVVLESPIGEWEESRMTQRPTKVEGTLELEVGPGRTELLRTWLGRRDRRTMRSATVIDTYGDQTGFVSAGVAAKSATMKVASGEDLMISVDCLGRTRVRTTPVVPTYPDLAAPYVFEEMIATIAGGPEYHLSEVEVAWDWQVQDDKFRSDGTGLLREVPTDGQSVIITLQHDFEHADLWDQAMSGVQVGLSLVFTRGSRVMSLVMPRCNFDEGDVEDNMQPLTLRALKGLDGTAAVTWSEA